MEAPRLTATFVVRVVRCPGGDLIGSVQRVRTGERRPFLRADAIGPLIAEMTENAGAKDAVPGASEPPVE